MGTVTVKKKTIYVWGLIAIIALIGFFSFAGSDDTVSAGVVQYDAAEHGDAQVGLDIGNRAPDFSVETSDGRQLSLSDFRNSGKTVVLYFMASWCPNCKRDLASANSAYPAYSDDVEFLTVSLEPRDNAPYLERYKNTGGHSWDFALSNPLVSSSYAVRYTTTKFAIDKDGIIRATNIGILSSSQWENFFNAVV